jgi:anti-sigma regulatory factor (Ser/Thr protein kinase)
LVAIHPPYPVPEHLFEFSLRLAAGSFPKTRITGEDGRDMGTQVAVDQMLPALPSSAGQARRLLRDALPGEASEEAVDAAALALSEIVTNALVHAGTPMRLRVILAPSAVRVELADGSVHLPLPRDYSRAAGTGRGLHMVTEVVDQWGAHHDEDGKVVWFEIADPPPAEPQGATGRISSTRRPAHRPMLHVELANVPLLMHAAWQEHAAGLLRELLLTRLEEDASAIDDHAAASAALSVLFEQLPAPGLGDDPGAIMARAVEPHVSAERVVLDLPQEAAADFDVLDELLRSAVRLAEEGKLLSPPTQPEIGEFRRWLCAQVRQQAAGGPPEAWIAPIGNPPPPDPRTFHWDPVSVSTSTRALVAADDTDQIVAASPAALALLGYDHRRELVGSRLICIIPTRYHQAHIAGLTLHLASGRGPLLGNRIAVPVLRADRTEQVIDLQIESRHLPDGRAVFVAELFA